MTEAAMSCACANKMWKINDGKFHSLGRPKKMERAKTLFLFHISVHLMCLVFLMCVSVCAYLHVTSDIIAPIPLASYHMHIKRLPNYFIQSEKLENELSGSNNSTDTTAPRSSIA